jgi:hypothetical protein
LAALEGRPTEAIALYRVALQGWRDLGLAWDQAQGTVEMVSLLDPADPEVRAAGEAAREILAQLGARPFLERLDQALEAGIPNPVRVASTS